MVQTRIEDVQDQVQMWWSPLFVAELIESTPIIALLNRDYDGEIKNGGDTVRVSQIKRPVGETKTIGVAGDSDFTPEVLVTAKVDVKADKRFIAAFDFSDLVELQSQIGSQDSAIRQAMLEAVQIQVNNYVYSLVAPVAGNIFTSIDPLTAEDVRGYRAKAGKLKWDKSKAWYGLLEPFYYSELMGDTTLASTDFVNDQPTVGGEIVTRRYGFNIIEDNSDGLITLSPISEKAGIFFHPDFMYLVMQRGATFKVSDNHSNNNFGFKISVHMIGGAKIGIEGDLKHITVAADA